MGTDPAHPGPLPATPLHHDNRYSGHVDCQHMEFLLALKIQVQACSASLAWLLLVWLPCLLYCLCCFAPLAWLPLAWLLFAWLACSLCCLCFFASLVWRSTYSVALLALLPWRTPGGIRTSYWSFMPKGLYSDLGFRRWVRDAGLHIKQCRMSGHL